MPHPPFSTFCLGTLVPPTVLNPFRAQCLPQVTPLLRCAMYGCTRTWTRGGPQTTASAALHMRAVSRQADVWQPYGRRQGDATWPRARQRQQLALPGPRGLAAAQRCQRSGRQVALQLAHTACHHPAGRAGEQRWAGQATLAGHPRSGSHAASALVPDLPPRPHRQRTCSCHLCPGWPLGPPTHAATPGG